MLVSTTPPRRRARLSLLVTVAAAISLTLPQVSPGASAAGAQSSGDPDAPELAVATVNGTGERVFYDVVDGMAIVDHDIILGSHTDIEEHGLEPLDVALPSPCPDGYSCGVIQTSSNRAWPNGVIPYTLSPGTSSSAAQNIQAAIDEWEQKTTVRFVPRTGERDYVEFVGTGNGNTCSSWLGRAGGGQAINYAGNGRGCLVHEIGHAVGLNHEQNRNDRDDHIDIDFTNISGNAASQFRKATGSADVGQYDFNSVMHYSAYAFALDPSRPVIIAKDGRDPRTIGGRGVLTAADVQAVDFVYGTNPPPPPPTTTPPTTAPSTTVPTTTVPTTTVPPTTAPPTTQPTTTNTVAPTTMPSSSTTSVPTTATTISSSTSTATTAPITTTTVQPTTTTAPTTTTTVQPTTTTAPITTTTVQATTTTAGPPGGDRKPVVEFVTVADGDTVPTRVPYGGITVTANDPDAGSVDGDGIRWVTLVLSDAETGRFLGARREYRSAYEWGLRLRSGRSYVLTAYAVSTRSAGGGWSRTSITIAADR